MVSISCSCYQATIQPLIPLLAKTRLPDFLLTPRIHRRRPACGPLTSIRAAPSSPNPPGGKRIPWTLAYTECNRSGIIIPRLVLRLSTEEVLLWDDGGAALREAVSRGVRVVVLDVGENSGGNSYGAACLLKSIVGDSAYLLISERVDVAAAVGACGVVLSDQSIPVNVAKNMMLKSKSDDLFNPLVARDVRNANTAKYAASFAGVDFIIISNDDGSWEEVLKESVTQNVMVPIFLNMKHLGDVVTTDVASKLLQLGAYGLVMSLDYLKLFSNDILEKIVLANYGESRFTQDRCKNSSSVKIDASTSTFDVAKGVPGFVKPAEREIKIIEAESLLVHEALAVIRKAAPMLSEVALLVVAVSRLKEPFLMVIAGEFNSGKSTVINALLGRRYLKEGVVPTTSEITLLCHSKMSLNKQEQCERNTIGQLICYLSSPILENMNIVDTPGTNVILQKQKRLTEEFVPHADLILFVISSDRPLTESEASFLQYVRQWKKKVVFVLNKLDIYQNTRELEEATLFIQENTQKFLGAGDVILYPVSARSALEAKLSALTFDAKNYKKILRNDPCWISSKFQELEHFLFGFLDGSTNTGMERMKLKLETPVAIAERLLNSSERLILRQQDEACQDLISINEIVAGIKAYTTEMETESISWKKRAVSLIKMAESQAVKLMEFTLQLSNINLVSSYAFKGEKSSLMSSTSILQNEIINPSLSDMQKLLREYSEWLQSKIAWEGKQCIEHLRKRCIKDLNLGDAMQSNAEGFLGYAEEHSLKVIESFSASAAAKLFEQEIREIVFGTVGGLGFAGLSASLLTSVLPTTLEDLIALAFCSAGGFAAISVFPARRKRAIEKVRKVSDGLAQQVEEAMRKELVHAAERLSSFAEFISEPYRDAARQRIDLLSETQEELADTLLRLQDLSVEIKNLTAF